MQTKPFSETVKRMEKSMCVAYLRSANLRTPGGSGVTSKREYFGAAGLKLCNSLQGHLRQTDRVNYEHFAPLLEKFLFRCWGRGASRLTVESRLWSFLTYLLTYFFTNTDLPGSRPFRFAGTNRLAVPPVKLTTVANEPGFPGCRPTDMKRSARRRDFSRIVIHLPSAT